MFQNMKKEPTITINQAKILYLLANTDKTSFQVGDFGTDLNTFQFVANSIEDLVNQDMMTTSEPHRESRTGDRKIDLILKCELTETGFDELGIVTGSFLNSEGEFDLETW